MRAALLRGESFTRLDVLDRWGCMKAPARIAELRREGLDIETVPVVRNNKRFALWRLKKTPVRVAEPERTGEQLALVGVR